MLNAEEIQKVRGLLGSSVWNDVVKPKLENRIRHKIKTLVLFPSERREEERDDNAIRSSIAELEWMLVSWQNEVIAFENNKRVDELHAAEHAGTPANP